jgi:putative transposase
VSTRRVEGLVQTLGVQGTSKSQAAGLAKTLDEEVAAFRARPLDGGPYADVWVDALAVKCREQGRIVNVAAVVATGGNAGGDREVSAWTCPPARTALAGRASCVTWSPAALPACSW